MGDVSAEPSMEDILSNIKRIISEEGEAVAPMRPRWPAAAARPAPLAPHVATRDEGEPDDDDDRTDEVLELRNPMPEPTSRPAPAPRTNGAAAPGPIASTETEAATRGALDALSRLVVKPDPATGDGTLEGLVRDMLRPMLREWIDANLPRMVEQMVSREIARITGQEG